MSTLTLDCAKIQEIKAKAELVWADSGINDEYKAHVDALTVLRANETAKLEPLSDPKKKNTMSIYWPAMCDNGSVSEVKDNNACDPDGPQISANCIEVETNTYGSYGFKIDEDDYEDSLLDMEEMIAKQELLTMKKLDEWWCRKYLAALELFAGTNQYTGGIGTVSGEVTTIPKEFWGGSLTPYLNMVAERNYMTNRIILTGENLYFANQIIPAMGGNANGVGENTLFKQLGIYIDIWNVDQAHGDKATWIIRKGATKLVTRALYSETPVTYGNGANITRWRRQSKNLPGIWYDIDYKTECSGKKIIHKWNYSTEGVVALNPMGCSDDITGVLLLECA